MNTLARFHALTEDDLTSGCVNWIGAKTPKGYGLFGLNRGVRRAHRVAYELFKGPIPDGKVVMHTCNNKGCVNVAHLKAGTQRQNHEDAIQAGLMPSGVECTRSNLTEEDVRDMRREYAKGGTSYGKLGKKHGITRQSVFRIVKRISWSHV